MDLKQKELNRKNKEKLKQYKKQLRSEKFDVENELKYNENDEAVIECKIGKAENLFNKFDLAQDKTLTEEFEQYLLEEVAILPMNENIAIKMYVDESFTEENEKQVKKAIKRHCSFNITADNVKMKRDGAWAITLYIFGFLCLFLSPYIAIWTKTLPYSLLSDFTSVLSWFAIWEATDIAFFDRSDIVEHRYNMLRLYNASITFERVPNMVVNQTVQTISMPVQNENKEKDEKKTLKTKKKKSK